MTHLGVQVTTLPRLAEQVAAPLMSPRTPATRAAVAAGWRSELDYGAGAFAAVRDQPAAAPTSSDTGPQTAAGCRDQAAAAHAQRQSLFSRG